MAHQLSPASGVDSGLSGIKILRSSQTEVDHAGTYRSLAVAVNQDEGAKVAAIRVGGERYGLIQAEGHTTDIVKSQAATGQLLECIYIHFVFDFSQGRADDATAKHHAVATPHIASILVHPYKRRIELI